LFRLSQRLGRYSRPLLTAPPFPAAAAGRQNNRCGGTAPRLTSPAGCATADATASPRRFHPDQAAPYIPGIAGYSVPAQNGGAVSCRYRGRCGGGSQRHSQRISNPQGAAHAIFMETIKPVSAAEMAAVVAADFTVASLRRYTFQGKYRMGVIKTTNDFAVVNIHGFIQGDAEIHRRIMEVLQPIHVISNGDGVLLFMANMVIPAGPGFFTLW